MHDAHVLAPEDAWIAHLDHEKFREDVHQIGKTLSSNQGKEDLRHLSKIVWMSRLCQWIGFATMWYCVNPISIFFLSISATLSIARVSLDEEDSPAPASCIIVVVAFASTSATPSC